jgi:hypothetical protein
VDRKRSKNLAPGVEGAGGSDGWAAFPAWETPAGEQRNVPNEPNSPFVFNAGTPAPVLCAVFAPNPRGTVSELAEQQTTEAASALGPAAQMRAEAREIRDRKLSPSASLV